MFLTKQLLKSLVQCQVVSHFNYFLYAWILITPTKLFSEITCVSYALTDNGEKTFSLNWLLGGDWGDLSHSDIPILVRILM